MARDPQALERFRREARAASALNHPNICTIYEIGEEAASNAFIAMEFLDGQTLKHRIAGRPLDNRNAVSLWPSRPPMRWTRRMPKASCIATSSPRTFSSPNAGTPRFWISVWPRCRRSARPRSSDNTQTRSFHDHQLTSPGSTLGTVAYMSPEQAKAQELDARSDLFSFGAVLYEMATGALPFRGGSSAEIFKAILDATPPPLTRLNPDAPAELERIVSKALEKDRNLRYQSAADLRSDLTRLKRDLDSGRASAVHLPLTAESASHSLSHVSAGQISAASPASSRKLLVFGLAALVIVVAIGAAVYWMRGGSGAKED